MNGHEPDEVLSAPYMLYAEDNPSDYLFFSRALASHDKSLRLVHQEDGNLARNYLLELVDQNIPLPRLVVLDIKMPGLNGLEVLEFIRSHPRLRRLPVLLLSSSNQERDILRAYAHSVNAYLVKPDRYHLLKELVCSINRFWICYNQVAA